MGDSSKPDSDEMEVDSFEHVEVCASFALDDDLVAAVQLYDKVVSGGAVSTRSVFVEISAQIQEKLQIRKKIKITSSRTSKPWLQYMQMVDILHLLIKAERTGDRMMHLKSRQKMLPFFAASGHNLYAKSAYIYMYVRQMLQLGDSHPDVLAFFKSGYHVALSSDRYWAGLSSDLVIEQTRRRTIKTAGGLTRGRGIGESQRQCQVAPLLMLLCKNLHRQTT